VLVFEVNRVWKHLGGGWFLERGKRWAPWWGPPVKQECELQLASDVREDVLDLRAQDEQGCDHDDGDEGKQNAVLGHRLPLLAAELDPCELEPIAEFHAVAPPFGGVENTVSGVAVEAGCGHVRRSSSSESVAGRSPAFVKRIYGAEGWVHEPHSGDSRQTQQQIPRVGYRDYCPGVREATLKTGDGRVVCSRCLIAERPWQRMRGLLGRAGLDSGAGMLFRPAGSIHMFFMRFAIDAVFCTADLEVIDVERNLAPWRVAGRKGANVVIELPAGAAEAVAAGDRLVLDPA
jgi:uncharacterized membrane protein (UPF0127 family)